MAGPAEVVASSDGLSLQPYTGDALTVGSEIHKLAFNVAMGRDWAGIHYPSDAEAGLRLAEDVAIATLQDLVNEVCRILLWFPIYPPEHHARYGYDTRSRVNVDGSRGPLPPPF